MFCMAYRKPHLSHESLDVFIKMHPISKSQWITSHNLGVYIYIWYTQICVRVCAREDIVQIYAVMSITLRNQYILLNPQPQRKDKVVPHAQVSNNTLPSSAQPLGTGLVFCIPLGFCSRVWNHCCWQRSMLCKKAI